MYWESHYYILLTWLDLNWSRQWFSTSTQPVSKLHFHFYANCVEVILTSVQLGQKWDFYNQLDRKSIFYSRQVVGKLVLKILSNLGRIIFLQFFNKAVLKMAFSSATTGRVFFCRHSPKRQSHRLPLGEIFWKIATEARIKSLVSAAIIWEGLWTKGDSHQLSLEG